MYWRACETLVKSPCCLAWKVPGQYRADSRFAPSQWETALLCNAICHWLGAHLESTLQYILWQLMSAGHLTSPATLLITFNSLTPGRFEWNFMQVIFKLISMIYGWGISCETAVRWMSLDLSDDKSALVQVMAWCRQATSHYLNQCWPRSMSPYGVTRPQWVQCCARWWVTWCLVCCRGSGRDSDWYCFTDGGRLLGRSHG